MSEVILVDQIETKIFVIRGQKVMIDRDLAQLYGVETKYLNRQVKRNMERFPTEFVFQLTQQEKNELVPKSHRFQALKHSTSLPFAFNEYGIAMLSSVLNSERAIKVNIAIMRAFVKLRRLIAANKELAERLNELEGRMDKKDREIIVLFESIRRLMQEDEKPKGKIGFYV